MKGQPYSNFIKLDGVECHARKGWRGFARPAGTNRRRKLIHQGALAVTTSKEGHKAATLWSRAQSWWRDVKKAYVAARHEAAVKRAAEITAEIAAAIQKEAAEKVVARMTHP
jgi:hypothetical protein